MNWTLCLLLVCPDYFVTKSQESTSLPASLDSFRLQNCNHFCSVWLCFPSFVKFLCLFQAGSLVTRSASQPGIVGAQHRDTCAVHWKHVFTLFDKAQHGDTCAVHWKHVVTLLDEALHWPSLLFQVFVIAFFLSVSVLVLRQSILPTWTFPSERGWPVSELRKLPASYLSLPHADTTNPWPHTRLCHMALGIQLKFLRFWGAALPTESSP